MVIAVSRSAQRSFVVALSLIAVAGDAGRSVVDSERGSG